MSWRMSGTKHVNIHKMTVVTIMCAATIEVKQSNVGYQFSSSVWSPIQTFCILN